MAHGPVIFESSTLSTGFNSLFFCDCPDFRRDHFKAVNPILGFCFWAGGMLSHVVVPALL